MCGRYALAAPENLAERFSADAMLEVLAPTFNVAPTRWMPVVVRNSPNRLELMRWGLIPSWAKDASIGARMINARAETLAEKPAFKRLFKSRRCLVPATGFYEWRQEGAGKQPYFIRLADGDTFAFAGLYDFWRDPDGNPVRSYTIITTEPNAVVAPIHNRMPVILSPEAEPDWVDPAVDDLDYLQTLLVPYPAARMVAYPVSKAVNRVTADFPELIAGPNNSQ